MADPTDALPEPAAVYAKILRAAARGTGVLLTPDECTALWADTAAVDAAVGGDGDDRPPSWLTPTERRRWLDALSGGGEYFDETLFRPGREVKRAD